VVVVDRRSTDRAAILHGRVDPGCTAISSVDSVTSLGYTRFVPSIRDAILAAFAQSPEREVHVRGLARQIGHPPPPVGQALAGLERAGLLTSRVIGTRRAYRWAGSDEQRRSIVGGLSEAEGANPAAVRSRSAAGRAMRSTAPLDFTTQLEPQAFENLALDVLADWRNWTLVPIGQLGADGGVDIRGVETVPRRAGGRHERRWRIQVKRWKKLWPSDVRRIVADAVPVGDDLPYGLLLVAACDLTAAARDAFEAEARARGVEDPVVLARTELAARLYAPQNAALLWRYFGLGSGIEGTVDQPAGLAVSPGTDLPLVGRDEELRRLRHGSGDWIVLGVPGVGKSRLVREAGGARFVTEAELPEIADSIRVRHPRRVVVDDAGLKLTRLEELLELRRRGLDFEIVATGWPQDADALRRCLPEANEIELDLLERDAMEALLRSMGITSYQVLGEIMRQAEGRPGWAVVLAKLALNGNAERVMTGRALIMEVGRFVGIGDQADPHVRPVLATLAALGHTTRDDLEGIADHLRMSLPALDAAIRTAATGGLLDRVWTSAGEAWEVRPEPLRQALVADWFFEQPLGGNFDSLRSRWPQRPALLQSAVDAAALGSISARRYVDRLLAGPDGLAPSLLRDVALLDEQAAKRVVQVSLDNHDRPGAATTEVVEAAARRYLLPEAVRALLTAAIGDERHQHPNPSHPIRILGEIARRLGPDGGTQFATRPVLLGLASDWLDEQPDDGRQVVWARLMVHVLSPTVTGAWAGLGSQPSGSLVEGIEHPSRLDAIRSELWPAVAERLDRLGPRPLAILIESLDDWLHIARGMEGPLGVRPSAEHRRSAGDFAEVMAADLTRAARFPAVQLRLLKTGRMFGLRSRVRPPAELRMLTWKPWYRRAQNTGRADRLLEQLGRSWASEDPDAVMRRLDEWRSAAMVAGDNLFPGVVLAMRAVANAAVPLEPFVRAALAAGLCGEAGPLYERGVAEADHLDWLPGALAGPCRPVVIAAALGPTASGRVQAIGLGSLTAGDTNVIDSVLFAHRSADDLVRQLLVHPEPGIRGRASLGFAVAADQHGIAIPPELKPTWRTAFLDAIAEDRNGHDTYQLTELLRRLVETDPDLVEEWLRRRLDAGWDAFHHVIPFHAEDLFRRLPLPNRDRLVRTFADAPFRYALLPLLMTPDGPWIGSLLDEGILSTGTVLQALSWLGESFEERLPIVTAAAPHLARHGVPAERIAGVASSGSWRGDESARYQQLIGLFEGLAVGSDRVVADIGRAGVAIFTAERDRAMAEERRERIRGM